MSFDVQAIRAEFPILSREVNGKPLVYLDSAASAQKPDAVIDAMANQARTAYANVHRGIHTLANETTEAFEDAREVVRGFLNAGSVDEIVFTKGATEAINLVANGLVDEIRPGDEILISVAEHHSNIVPWHFLRERNGAVIKWVETRDDGSIDLDNLRSQLSDRTKLVAITHMSNVLGTVTDIDLVASLAHEAGALILVDGCQGAVHLDVDVQRSDVDFYVFSGHKIYGPTGIGALYGKMKQLERLRPYQGGGEMIEVVERDRITYNKPPHRFEAGTPPILEAVGVAAAIRWMQQFDREQVSAHKKAIHDRMMDGIRGINGVRIHGTTENKGPVLTFSVDEMHPHDLAQIMDRYGVAVRAGHHCAQPLMQSLDVSATLRASVGIYNTMEEADAFLEAFGKARMMLG